MLPPGECKRGKRFRFFTKLLCVLFCFKLQFRITYYRGHFPLLFVFYPFLYSCSRLQVTPEDRSLPFVAQIWVKHNACKDAICILPSKVTQMIIIMTSIESCMVCCNVCCRSAGGDLTWSSVWSGDWQHLIGSTLRPSAKVQFSCHKYFLLSKNFLLKIQNSGLKTSLLAIMSLLCGQI